MHLKIDFFIKVDQVSPDFIYKTGGGGLGLADSSCLSSFVLLLLKINKIFVYGLLNQNN